MQAPPLLKVAIIAREKHARVKALGKAHPGARPRRLHLLQPGLVALGTGLVGDLPVRVEGSRHALDGLEHVALAHVEGGDVDGLALEVGEAGRSVVGVVLEDLEAQ